jgi:hypothetical protein
MLTYSEFENIVLNHEEYKALKKLKNRSPAIIDKEHANTLIAAKLITHKVIGYDDDLFPIYNDMYSISENGKRYFVFKTKQIEKFLFKSVLVPIVVAAITALITIWLTSLLQPPPVLPPK